ncbi:MAG: NAD(+) synthase [Thermoflexales bacterium]|nr:NAD(+) synthase [Thermoflexales bacterium]MCS7324347.1 NAD(+) synthase [Thermoflexales bacterium]MCX7940099.1 NAD(+) synthase [Thermoflexales bacterium]MDW8054849.1 NAD(+) synthase [Anaerolineae bacterium]MDW8293054.1 NAD(+) synthase [Anaerolineae bacterium]
MTGSLFSAPALGFVRVAAVAPELRVADVDFNQRAIRTAMEQARERGCALALFPELCLTGYTCGDLFRQFALLNAAQEALLLLAEATRELDIAAVVGLPLAVEGRLFNCAALLGEGRVLGIVPKTYLPNYAEFYEQRHFTSALRAPTDCVRVGDLDVPFGNALIFRDATHPGCVLGIEICEDLWVVEPPSGRLALGGATVLLNLSASPAKLGQAAYRRDLVRQQSARCLAAYVYSGAGPGESSSDLVFDGHALIAENGQLLAESQRFVFETHMVIADVDVQKIAHERALNVSFAQAAPPRVTSIEIRLPESKLHGALLRPVPARPFVPSDPAARAQHCREVFAIQSTGLARRLRHTGVQRVTLGISGGLDSTLALLVTARAFDMLNLPREGILAVTMPGFGTTERTYHNALALMRALGVSVREIPIRNAVLQHFADIGHDPNVHDVTFENAQARERTQILMDLANQIGGLVIGTGDLSELALGWATYNGDHMSMYHVNAGVPKTLVRYLVEWSADEVFSGETARVLRDILATPITPELLPPKDNQLQQKTEEVIGPYVLHDFFLFQHVRNGFPPHKVFFLARHAFADEFDAETILKWLGVFYERFFSQQFKRNAMPDGPKVGSVALSPRGDWRMPSDAHATLWRTALETLKAQAHLVAAS